MKALVTGATGFVGSAIVRQLQEDGQQVKALVRKGSDLRNLEKLDIEIAYGDITDYDSVARAMQGCNSVYHGAAMVAFWVPRKDRHLFDWVNVEGSKNVFSAALKQDVEKVIYTSTISTIGSYGKDTPTTENHNFNLWDMSMEYEQSKYSAEFEAYRFAAQGLPIVVVMPSAPLGARDIKPNPVGKLILDFLARRIPGYIDGGANFIDVDDVAYGHILAAKKGKVGDRYMLGHENLSVVDLFSALEAISGVPAPKLKLPQAGAVKLAQILEFISDHITNQHPLYTAPMVKFSSLYYYLDTSKAKNELGFEPKSSVQQAAINAIEWFLQNDYLQVNDKNKSRIRQHLQGQSLTPVFA
ncbi:NAD-dependent epimerase/dehydratase family protein (plasmid) [Nostoc sp. C052]|uniref:SDR family oxidoreductase n=1 Tax=Nostoc sp. C052 TaxID=2576902 RepID=UPI0015C363E7|nr:SDR family oxidoreductase [Nostoc sp. C052]QLE46261.1 NAD-dependent epimerase/dehydratase family protein [Nostoc sp. C052]